jgi:hypothetical protein
VGRRFPAQLRPLADRNWCATFVADCLSMLTARELGGVALLHVLGLEVDQLEQLPHASRDALLRPAQQARDGRDVLAHRLMREQPDLLDHVADLAAQLPRVALEDASAAEQDVAAVDGDHPVDQAHRRRLAGARRADEDADLTRRHREGELADRGHPLAGVTLAHLSQLELGGLRKCRRPLVMGGVRGRQGGLRAGGRILAQRRRAAELAGGAR